MKEDNSLVQPSNDDCDHLPLKWNERRRWTRWWLGWKLSSGKESVLPGHILTPLSARRPRKSTRGCCGIWRWICPRRCPSPVPGAVAQRSEVITRRTAGIARRSRCISPTFDDVDVAAHLLLFPSFWSPPMSRSSAVETVPGSPLRWVSEVIMCLEPRQTQAHQTRPRHPPGWGSRPRGIPSHGNALGGYAS